MKRKILFFIEPVPAHGNVLFHENKMALVSRLAEAHAGNCEVSVIASPQLCRLGGPHLAYRFELSIDLCLRHYDYDVKRYIIDVCGRAGQEANQNLDLTASLTHADAVICPDHVVSFTDNAYLQHVFTDRCLFSEVSPIPRWFTEPCLMFDPRGFRPDNAIARYVNGPYLWEFDETFKSAFEAFWLDPVTAWSESIGMAQWVESVRGEKKVMILALQPAADMNYIGSGVPGDEIALIRRAAKAFSSDFRILVFWHAASNLPDSSLIAELQESYPNLAFPPEHLCRGHTEAALIHVDAVTGISSNLLFLGAVLGLEVYALGTSRFSCLSTFGSRISGRRLDLLAFTADCYATPESVLIETSLPLPEQLDAIKARVTDFDSDRHIATAAWLRRILRFAQTAKI